MSLLLTARDIVENVLSHTVGRVFWPPTSVAVLVEEDRGVLALDVDGHHELPGGLVKAGELPKEAGKREVKEETGFDVELGNLLDIRSDARGNPGIHFFFEAEIVGGEQDGSWEGEPVFIPREEVRERKWRLHHSHVHEYLFPDEDAVHD
ncbi:MAG: NUDIX hydrolase [Candidatus Nanohaloarchaea archaeon]|nr:NUDIX hydrolase [Candidatus Nanohaloarchaea archaeon]